jgi:hypothetical protein
MSKLALKGALTGAATFTIEAPATSTNRTLTLPDAAGNLVLDSATQTLTNKSIDGASNTLTSLPAAQLTGDVAADRITGALNASGAAPIYACRAWVNFNGTGTVAIRASGNVSSITDNGVGDYTVNFTTAMPDANYSTVGTVDWTDNNSAQFFVRSNVAPTVNGIRVATVRGLSTAYDATICSVTIFR